jgi:hypothetical protein
MGDGAQVQTQLGLKERTPDSHSFGGGTAYQDRHRTFESGKATHGGNYQLII